jgi:cell division protein FtsB
VQCAGFATEEYDLYAVGALEPEPAAEVDIHLAAACDVCRNGVRRSLHFWALFGGSLAPIVEPPALQPAPIIPFRRSSQPDYRRMGSVAAAIAVIVGGAAWYVARGTDQHTLKQLSAQLAQSEDQLNQLRSANSNPPSKPEDVARLRDLTAQLQNGETALGAARKSLTDADHRYQEATSALATEKTNAAQLAAALAQQKDELEKGTTEQRRLTAQVESLSTSLQAAEEQTRRLTAEAASLTQERTRLLETVQRMEMQAGQGRRMISLLSSPGTRLVAVNGTEDAPKAVGYALVSEKNRVLFFANDLPPLPGGRVYQLWLIRDKAPAVVSAGVFEQQTTRSGQVEFAQADLIQGITTIAVTDEPPGGSPSPTGHKLLVGVVKS